MAEEEMDFRILGPLEVHRDVGPLTLGAAKQRALLAILLLHANEAVSSDRLVDELWGARPPDTAANALQVYVAQLRKALEPERPKGTPSQVVVTRPGGYLLRVEPDGLDAERFERRLADGRAAAAAGDAAAAAELLGEALGLWRGDPLADFTYEPFAQAEIARLEELRVSALEERFDADIALGRHAAVVGELEALVRKHPLRERLRGQLMLALYRAGRQAEALQVYQDAHRALTEELGIVPGPELQRLEQAILRHDAALELLADASAEPAPIAEPARPAPETRKTVTVLVAARPAAESIDPEAARRLDERYLDAATRAVERHGGSVESVLGDRVMAVFGVPRVHEDDALRAARAAVELPGGQAGVATGEVVASESASGGPSVAGEPVGRAGELADTAPEGGILLAEETHALLGDAARSEPVGDRDGRAWGLLELVSPPPPLSRAPEIPIVGRESELAQLTGALDRTTRERTVHLFTILGAAGIGKTRLAEEFVSRLAGDATVLAGRCVPYGEGITFWPLREIVGRLTAAAPLSQLLADEDEGELVVERVAEAIGRAEATSSVEEIFWAFRRLLETIARERPTVILLEDVHWAEPTLLDFVEYVAERARGSPILVLCLARPELLEERPGWGGGKRNASSLFLERLSDAESERLIEALAPGLPDRTRAPVQETAEGNPLFLEQILAMLTEEVIPEGEVPVPATIQAVLAARLDRLGPGERAVIERAAVVGKEFSKRAVVELVPDDARQFASRHLDALAGKELVNPGRSQHPGGGSFEFRHVLIQQSTYRAIPKRLRATLHERVAEWLERTVGEESPEYAERAGYHLEQTYHYRAEIDHVSDEERALARRAAELLGTAGSRAFRRGDMPASLNLFDRATSLLSDHDPARLELLPNLGYALFEVGELERADRVLTAAIETAQASGERGIEWAAVAKRNHVRMYTAQRGVDLERIAADAENAIEVLAELGDDAGLARAWTLLAEVRISSGDAVEAARAAGRGAGLARRALSRREEAWALGAHADALLFGPPPVVECMRRLEGLLGEAAANPLVDPNLSAFVAVLEAMRGDFEQARARAARARQLTRDLGLSWQDGYHARLSGYVELLAGDPVAAERDIREAKRVFGEIGDTWLLAIAVCELPRAVYEQGRYEAAAALAEAIEDSPAPADREWQIKRRGVRASLLAHEGRIGEAERLAREAVAIAADTDFLWSHADALMDLAEVLRIGGRPEDAARFAEEALRLYERKGIVPSAARARELIEELRAVSPRGA